MHLKVDPRLGGEAGPCTVHSGSTSSPVGRACRPARRTVVTEYDCGLGPPCADPPRVALSPEHRRRRRPGVDPCAARSRPSRLLRSPDPDAIPPGPDLRPVSVDGLGLPCGALLPVAEDDLPPGLVGHERTDPVGHAVAPRRSPPRDGSRPAPITIFFIDPVPAIMNGPSIVRERVGSAPGLPDRSGIVFLLIRLSSNAGLFAGSGPSPRAGNGEFRRTPIRWAGSRTSPSRSQRSPDTGRAPPATARPGRYRPCMSSLLNASSQDHHRMAGAGTRHWPGLVTQCDRLPICLNASINGRSMSDRRALR